MQGHLIAVSMFCGAREKMNEWQSKSLCSQIINEHPTLTLMEFILFCSRLRSAKYGKFTVPSTLPRFLGLLIYS